ncbi:transient receptor potential cation channel protein painless-like [Drosophila novamexicana]|uniref:transient receptor potential cation channel protein painless-like n=1 Tax=Drosophila novamexicana TaxID=47314 RepID=UPI0011E5EF90|nr:transient receptor potential cation channel protein painless-like [Drosophila novamexicana]
MDLQQQLGRALEQRDSRGFEEALSLGANPNEHDDRGISIYEKSLSSAGCAEFIRLCLRSGCSVLYMNQQKQKAAINYAVDSTDSEHVKVLLEHQGVPVNHKYNDLTPLNALARNLSRENASRTIECIRELLMYGASPNIPDDNDMTPLHRILLNRQIEHQEKETMVNLFLNVVDIDIDSSCDGEVRQELQEQMPHLVLPPVRDKSRDLTSGRNEDIRGQLLREVRNDNVERCQQLLSRYQGNKFEFLEECNICRSHAVFDSLLQTDIDINEKSKVYERTIVEIAIAYGNFYCLAKLLQHEKLRLSPNLELLHQLIGRLDERSEYTSCDYVECFKLILDSSQVNVNEADKSGRTPLHYAILYNNEFAIRALLHHGAYLGAKSMSKDIAIQGIGPELLEHHFDECIKVNEMSRADKYFTIVLDYTNLKLPNDMRSNIKHYELESIVAMGESRKLRHLLNHPLIRTYITVMWQNISFLFHFYFFASFIFNILAIANILVHFRNSMQDSPNVFFLVLLSRIGIGYFVVCELINSFLGIVFWTTGRFLNVAHIVMLVVSDIVQSNPPTYNARVFAAYTILLIGLRLTKLLGYLPYFSLSTHVLMLKRVSLSFLKSCITYSILIISFGLCFYILNFHNLSDKNVLEAIFKTIVMSTGEFDESNLDYQKNILSCVLFIVFVIGISIVLMNLLGALAFNDTQAIKSQAEVNSLICQAKLLSCYEVFLTKPWRRLESLRKLLHRLLRIKNTSIPQTVSVSPNKEDNFNGTGNVISQEHNAQDIPANCVEMKPLTRLSNPKDLFNLRLSYKMVTPMLQIIDRKAKAEQN